MIDEVEEKYKLNSEFIRKQIDFKFGSVKEFAIYSDIPQETIYFWLRTKKMPSDKLFFLMELLHITDLKKVRKGD